MRRRKPLLAVVTLAAATGLVLTLLPERALRSVQPSDFRYALSAHIAIELSVEQPTVDAGEPFEVQVTFRNKTKHQAWVPWSAFGGPPHDLLTWHVRTPAGGVVETASAQYPADARERTARATFRAELAGTAGVEAGNGPYVSMRLLQPRERVVVTLTHPAQFDLTDGPGRHALTLKLAFNSDECRVCIGDSLHLRDQGTYREGTITSNELVIDRKP